MRNVIVGKNSKVWRALESAEPMRGRDVAAIGHSDLSGFRFLPGDRVWLLSYSPKMSENRRIIDIILLQPIESLVYVSSSSTIVAERTTCYGYPSAKLAAERYAAGHSGVRILTLGLVYEDPSDLPAGDNATTSTGMLVGFIANPAWRDPVDGRYPLMERVSRPFSGTLERICHRLYGDLIRATGSWPCLLRPLDLALRAVGYRWYGYTYLSNQIWTRIISS